MDFVSIKNVSEDIIKEYDWPSDDNEIWRHITSVRVYDSKSKTNHCSLFLNSLKSKKRVNAEVEGLLLARPGSIDPNKNEYIKPLKIKLSPELYSFDFGLNKTSPNRGLWYCQDNAWYKIEKPCDEYKQIFDEEYQKIKTFITIHDYLVDNSNTLKSGERECNKRIEDIIPESLWLFVINEIELFRAHLPTNFPKDKNTILFQSLDELKSFRSKKLLLLPSTSIGTDSKANKVSLASHEEHDEFTIGKKSLSKNIVGNIETIGERSVIKPNNSDDSSVLRKRSLSPVIEVLTSSNDVLKKNVSNMDLKSKNIEIESDTKVSQNTQNDSERRIKKKVLDNDDFEPAIGPGGMTLKTLGRDVYTKKPRQALEEKNRHFHTTQPRRPPTSVFIPGTVNISNEPKYHRPSISPAVQQSHPQTTEALVDVYNRPPTPNPYYMMEDTNNNMMDIEDNSLAQKVLRKKEQKEPKLMQLLNDVNIKWRNQINDVVVIMPSSQSKSVRFDDGLNQIHLINRVSDEEIMSDQLS